MNNLSLALLFVTLLVSAAMCDVYMHNPRGSNNRNCERDANRRNANRLFDSQNNDKGGYACPRPVSAMRPNEADERMYYYTGSVLHIEWTLQHSCYPGGPSRCDVILQYMCSDVNPGLRDGHPTRATNDNNDNRNRATDTIPVNDPDNLLFGQHEPLLNYQKCSTRDRNSGLFTADRQLQTAATSTRQNQNANRHGYECAEERDYYPYWHPTYWRDIAIFTWNDSMCEWYRNESQNVKGKGECFTTAGAPARFNNFQSCVSNGGKWIVNDSFIWNIPKPECFGLIDKVASRDNHLGNAQTGQMAAYDWVIPNHPDKSCVLRIRYNMSAAETPFNMDSTRNGANAPFKEDEFKQWGGYDSPLQLSLNTNQVPRAFEDRSYVFEIRKRPDNIPSWVKIHNLNVRGKRGNIVDTYPAVEYDYVPNNLQVDASDYVHIQWTGSDYNDAQTPNDGEGGAPDITDPNNLNNLRTDRNNMVQVESHDSLLPVSAARASLFYTDSAKTVNTDLLNLLAFIKMPVKVNGTCLPELQQILAVNLANNDRANAQRVKENCAKLNGATTPYFDAGLVQFKANGIFYYMSSRNNNFSNRQQKGVIQVVGGSFNSAGRLQASGLLLAIVFVFLAIWL